MPLLHAASSALWYRSSVVKTSRFHSSTARPRNLPYLAKQTPREPLLPATVSAKLAFGQYDTKCGPRSIRCALLASGEMPVAEVPVKDKSNLLTTATWLATMCVFTLVLTIILSLSVGGIFKVFAWLQPRFGEVSTTAELISLFFSICGLIGAALLGFNNWSRFTNRLDARLEHMQQQQQQQHDDVMRQFKDLSKSIDKLDTKMRLKFDKLMMSLALGQQTKKQMPKSRRRALVQKSRQRPGPSTT